MKKLLFTLTMAIAAFVVQAKDVYLFSYFVGNSADGLHLAYSYDGLKWTPLNGGKSFLKPQVGEDKLMRDPFIISGKDGKFHMVWTSSWTDQIIGYASSEDLINWSDQKAIPVMMHEPTAKNCWAPEIVYDDKTKEYIIFWATTIPGRHTPIAYSEREKDLNHRMYCTRTKDFKTFTPTEMFFNPDFSVIDASIIKDGKEYIMFLKNENPNPAQKNIRWTKTKDLTKGFPTQVSESISGKDWVEGPAPLVVKEYMYVYFDKYRNGRYGAIRSKDRIHWEEVTDQLQMPKGARHGAAFKVSGKILKNLLNAESK